MPSGGFRDWLLKKTSPHSKKKGEKKNVPASSSQYLKSSLKSILKKTVFYGKRFIVVLSFSDIFGELIVTQLYLNKLGLNLTEFEF